MIIVDYDVKSLKMYKGDNIDKILCGGGKNEARMENNS